MQRVACANSAKGVNVYEMLCDTRIEADSRPTMLVLRIGLVDLVI